MAQRGSCGLIPKPNWSFRPAERPPRGDARGQPPRHLQRHGRLPLSTPGTRGLARAAQTSGRRPRRAGHGLRPESLDQVIQPARCRHLADHEHLNRGPGHCRPRHRAGPLVSARPPDLGLRPSSEVRQPDRRVGNPHAHYRARKPKLTDRSNYQKGDLRATTYS